jgi:phosphate-selective porin OprO/OprP
MKLITSVLSAAGFRRLQSASLIALIAAGMGTFASSPASAEDVSALEKQIQRIDAKNRAEIAALKAEIASLRKGGAAGGKVVKGAAVIADEPKILMKKNPYHFGFSSADGQNTVELTGRLHMDVGGYPGLQRQPGLSTAALPGLGYGMNFRRARIGVQGIFAGDFAYGLIYDFGGTSDNGTSGSTSGGIENAFITYNGFYSHGQQFPIALDIGAIDVPWTLDEPMGSNDLMFMERSSAQVIATSLGGAGDSRTVIGFRSNDSRYWLGAYLTGPTTGAAHSATTSGLGPQLSFVARGTYNIWEDKATNSTVHLGFNYANTFDPRTGSATPYASGVAAISDRPELRIDTTSFLTTTVAIPASDVEVFGAEAAATYQNFFVQGEYYHYVIDTKVGLSAADTNFVGGRTGPSASFDGGYVQASYTIGGQRKYKPASGAYSGVIPDVPLSWGGDGWGALEIAGRFSVVDLGSNTLRALATSGTVGYAGLTDAKQTSYGAGLNYYPNGNLKFMLDYEHVIVDKNTYVAPATKTGATIDWIGARSQFVF